MAPIYFKHDLFEWLSSILDHWGSAVTGGILIALYGLLKDRYPRKVGTWSITWKLSVCFLAFAIFQSWEFEYLSRIGREKDLRTANLQRNQVEQYSQQYQRSNASCQSILNQSQQAESAALSRTQSAQTITQAAQSKIQDCLVTLSKVNAPEKFYLASSGSNIGVGTSALPTGENGQFGVLVVLSNRVIPVKGKLTCESPFTITARSIVNPDLVNLWDSSMVTQPEFKKSFDVRYPAKFGGYGSMLIFTIFGFKLNAGDCKFE